MRVALALAFVLLALDATARAADDTLQTGAEHEVVWTPATAVPVRGPRFAPVTIDVYVALGHLPSYATAELARHAAEHAGDVRVIMHAFSFGPPSELGLEALLEAADQGRFWPLFDRMAQTRAVTFSPIELERLGREAGLDEPRLAAALETRKQQGPLHRLRSAAGFGRNGDHHPPELLVNGRRVSPWSGEEAVTRAVNEARVRAHELLDEGVPLSQLYERIIERDEEVPFVIDPLGRASHKRITVDVTNAPARGPANAPITIVTFGNLACVPCAELAASLQKLQATYPSLVRVVWKNLPTPNRSTIAQMAAEYAVAADLQGRFWELYDLAMSTRLQPSRASAVELERLARSCGIDSVRLHADVASGRAHEIVERDAEEARRLGVPTAGSVVVNGIPVASAPSYELLERLITQELDTGVLDRLRRR
ncbi:MAG TPA: DsbA family protein [Polyangia bacterium]|jgi:protein-disulfide isomerase|nr:DsbA family protein [Polyangia bacterium]